MNLQSSTAPSAVAYGLVAPVPSRFDAERVVLRHLKTPEAIASVLHLREEIDLSAHASASSDFAFLEKKETSWGSSSPSNSRAKR